MGGRKEDYAAAAPPQSYLHVEDYATPKDLAELLLKLDKDDDLYNNFFRWKNTGEFINTKFWCRLCSLIHDDSGTKQWYDDIEGWWRGEKTCTYDRWDQNKNYVVDWDKEMNG